MTLLTFGRSNRANILAGLFATAAFLMLGAWIAIKLLGQNFLRQKYTTFAADVTGLREGTPVVAAGYPIGIVTDITYKWQSNKFSPSENQNDEQCTFFASPPLPSGDRPLFRLTLAIEKGWSVREGSELMRESANLVGQPILAFAPGTGLPLCPGSSIPFANPPSSVGASDLAELINHAKRTLAAIESLLKQDDTLDLTRRLGDVLAKTQETVARFGNTADAFTNVVNDSKILNIKRQTENAVTKLNRLLDDTEKLTTELRAAAPLVNDAMTELRPPLGRAANNIDISLRLTTARLPAILSALERSAQDLSGLLVDLRNNPALTVQGRTSAPSWETGAPQ